MKDLHGKIKLVWGFLKIFIKNDTTLLDILV